jgi:LuxR family transcriptional regulator, maltose regulon positive regulatory protein
MAGARELLEALPRHQTAHAALLADILDVLNGSSPVAKEPPSLPPGEELTPGELRVLRYLSSNLSRPEIAGELSLSPNTVNAHVAASTPSSRFVIGPRPCSARGSCGCWPQAARASPG